MPRNKNPRKKAHCAWYLKQMKFYRLDTAVMQHDATRYVIHNLVRQGTKKGDVICECFWEFSHLSHILSVESCLLSPARSHEEIR